MSRLSSAVPAVPAVLLVATSVLPLAVDASEDLAKNAGCTMCHATDARLVGPSFKEVAAKYKEDAAAPAALAQSVRNGSKGKWGAAPMMAIDASKVSDADLEAVIAWILQQ